MIQKILSFFSTTKLRIMFYGFIIGTSFYAGWATHKTIINSEKAKSLQEQLDKAQKAPKDIIEFNQKLRDSNASKDACFNTRLPADAARLLNK